MRSKASRLHRSGTDFMTMRSHVRYPRQEAPIPDAPQFVRSICTLCNGTGWITVYALRVTLPVKGHPPIAFSRREGEEMANTLREQLQAEGFDSQVTSAAKPCACKTA